MYLICSLVTAGVVMLLVLVVVVTICC